MDLTIVHAISPVISVFENLAISYYIGGSVASSAYGIARATLDVDIISNLSIENVESFTSLLKEKYYIDEEMIKGAIEDKSSFNIIHLDSMIKIDIFIQDTDAYHQKAMQRKRKDTFDDQESTSSVFLATPEDVIISKLAWYNKGNRTSQKQWHDIIGVLKVQKGALDIDYLQYWTKTLGLNDLLEKAFAGNVADKLD